MEKQFFSTPQSQPYGLPYEPYPSLKHNNSNTRRQSNFRTTLKWKRTDKTETTNEQKKSDLIGSSNEYKHAWLLVG